MEKVLQLSKKFIPMGYNTKSRCGLPVKGHRNLERSQKLGKQRAGGKVHQVHTNKSTATLASET